MLLPYEKRRRVVAATAGILTSAIWQIANQSGIEVGGITIFPAMLGLLTLFINPLPVGPNERLWYFAAALAVTNLPGMTFENPHPLSGWKGALMGAILAAPILIAALQSSRVVGSRTTSLTRIEASSILFVGISIIAICQGYNRIMRANGVPNEDRSMFIGDTEVHHITWGVLVIVYIGSIWNHVGPGRLKRRAAILALGCGIGMAWDEWLYSLTRPMTDDNYFSVETILGATLAAIFSGCTWLVCSTKTSNPGAAVFRLSLIGDFALPFCCLGF